MKTMDRFPQETPIHSGRRVLDSKSKSAGSKRLVPRMIQLLFLCCMYLQRTLAFEVSSSIRVARHSDFASSPRSSCATRLSSSTSTTCQTVSLPHIDFGVTQDSSLATPVIFLHGLLGSKRNFGSIGASLSKQLAPRRILGVDLRNHGDTLPHHDSMTYSDMANDVLQFMSQQSMERAILVGHSMGGKVAQACALMEPDRIQGLVVLDIAPVQYSTQDAHWKAVHDIIQTMTTIHVGAGVTKQAVDQQLRNAIPDPALRAFVLTNLQVRSGACDWKIPIHTIAHELDQLAAFDFSSSHQQYHGDVFFIHGGQSRFVGSRYLTTIADYFPNHLLTTIRGAGHWLHAEAPDDTTALLKRYLDR